MGILGNQAIFKKISNIEDITKFTTTTGTVNAMSVSIGNFDFTKDGNIINIIPNLTNTGACTISINGTSKAIKKFDTTLDTFIDLVSGDLKKNTPIMLSYNVSQGFFVYAPKVSGASTPINGWMPLSGWQDISNPPTNTISMLFSDGVLNNAFNVTTSGSVNYTVTVTGTTGDTTSTCVINGTTVNFGTAFSIASNTQCNITFTSGSGKNAGYGYTTFKVDITSSNTILTCKMAKHSNDTVCTYHSLSWCVVNANINDTAYMFYSNTSTTCTRLQAVDLSRTSLTNIGAYAFQNCYNLHYVKLPSTLTTISNSSFVSTYSLQSIDLPSGVTTLGTSIFQSCAGLRSVAIPSGVASLGTSVFQSCSGLQSVVLPSGVTTLGTSVFNGCNSLQSITIPSTVTSIGTTVFTSCYSLKAINNLENVTASNIDFGCASCYNLESLNAPNITFTRIAAQGTSTTIGKLHSITFSASSTFSYATAPQFDISYNSFSASELNSVFTALPTVSGKTIKVTGNPGTGTCDTSIATAKGWTVTIA